MGPGEIDVRENSTYLYDPLTGSLETDFSPKSTEVPAAHVGTDILDKRVESASPVSNEKRVQAARACVSSFPKP